MTEVTDVMPVYMPHVARMSLPTEFRHDKEHTYRMAAADENRVEFLKSIGYEIVVKADGSQHRVDKSILMRCKKSEHEMRNKQRQLRTRQMSQAPRQKVKTTAESLGVEVSDQTREYRGSMAQGLAEAKEANEPGEITRGTLQQAGLLKPQEG